MCGERHTTPTAVDRHCVAGPCLRETGLGEDVDVASAWGTSKLSWRKYLQRKEPTMIHHLVPPAPPFVYTSVASENTLLT